MTPPPIVVTDISTLRRFGDRFWADFIYSYRGRDSGSLYTVGGSWKRSHCLRIKRWWYCHWYVALSTFTSQLFDVLLLLRDLAHKQSCRIQILEHPLHISKISFDALQIVYEHTYLSSCPCLYVCLSLCLAAGVDYQSIQSELTFSQTMRQQCVNVTTIDDTDLVEMEAFNLRLSSLDANVVLSIDTATINITENDSKCSRFWWLAHWYSAQLLLSPPPQLVSCPFIVSFVMTLYQHPYFESILERR